MSYTMFKVDDKLKKIFEMNYIDYYDTNNIC